MIKPVMTYEQLKSTHQKNVLKDLRRPFCKSLFTHFDNFLSLLNTKMPKVLSKQLRQLIPKLLEYFLHENNNISLTFDKQVTFSN